MKQLTLEVPDDLGMNEQELLMMLATKLYQESKLSLGQAAEMVNTSKRNFVELLGRYGASVFNFPASDISEDVNNAW